VRVIRLQADLVREEGFFLAGGVGLALRLLRLVRASMMTMQCTRPLLAGLGLALVVACSSGHTFSVHDAASPDGLPTGGPAGAGGAPGTGGANTGDSRGSGGTTTSSSATTSCTIAVAAASARCDPTT